VRVFGLYLFATVVGVGLLLFSVLGGADSDASDFDLGADLDGEVEIGHHHGLAAGMSDVVLGLFRPRNLTFLLAAFGATGTLLTIAGTNAASTFVLATSMGVGAWLLTHTVFTWLRRTDSAVDALSDRDLEGTIGTVTLPIEPGHRGRITVVVAGRQTYLTARLDPEFDRSLGVGTEVLIRHTDGGVAEVIPTDTLGLPPSTS
jgi:membrane protein implicated in regulation of membrane protease activity